MRRPIAVAAAAGTLAVAGTAVAATGGGPVRTLFEANRDDRQAEFSRELASKLGRGVTAADVSKALSELRREHRTEMRADLAKSLVAELGVSADKAESALRKAEDQAKASFRRGERPRRDFVTTLGSELGKSESQVRQALRAVRRDRLDARLDELVEDGRLSRSEANRIRRRFEEGPRGLHHRRGGRGLRHRGPGQGFFGGPEVPLPPPPGG